MNAKDAKRVVYELAARSLRQLANSGRRFEQMPELQHLKPAERVKVKEQMKALADKLVGVERPPIEGEVTK